MLRVVWWLVVAEAANQVLWSTWLAFGIPSPGYVVVSLASYTLTLVVVAAQARGHLQDRAPDPAPRPWMCARVVAPVVLLSLGSLALSFQLVGVFEALNVLPAEVFDLAGGTPDHDGLADDSSSVSMFVGHAVLPAIFEEATYRGVVLTALATMMSVRRAIVISALVFAAVHFRIEHTFDTFLAGLAYGWIYVRTRSLLPTMLAHFLHNSGCVLMSLTIEGSSVAGVPLDAYGLLPAWIGWAAALLAGIALIWIRQVPLLLAPLRSGSWAPMPR